MILEEIERQPNPPPKMFFTSFRDSAMLQIANLVFNLSKVAAILSVAEKGAREHPSARSLQLACQALSRILSLEASACAKAPQESRVVGAAMAKEVGCATLLQAIKSQIHSAVVTRHLLDVLQKVARLEKGFGVIARLHGAIEITSRILEQHSATEVVSAALRLLKTFCSCSPNNVEAVMKPNILLSVTQSFVPSGDPNPRIIENGLGVLSLCAGKCGAKLVASPGSIHAVIVSVETCLDMAECIPGVFESAVKIFSHLGAEALAARRREVMPTLYRLLEAREVLKSEQSCVELCDLIWAMDIGELRVSAYVENREATCERVQACASAAYKKVKEFLLPGKENDDCNDEMAEKSDDEFQHFPERDPSFEAAPIPICPISGWSRKSLNKPKPPTLSWAESFAYEKSQSLGKPACSVLRTKLAILGNIKVRNTRSQAAGAAPESSSLGQRLSLGGGVAAFAHDKTFLSPPLRFSSNFESGNLAAAFRSGEHEYNLFLSADAKTIQYVQWFYFAVRGVRRHTKYTFNIVNNEKPDSQFNYGMRPLMHCEKKGMWRRVGEDVSYFENPLRKGEPGRACYSVRFTFKLPMEFEAGSVHYFSYCYPYTYTDLESDLGGLCEELRESQGGEILRKTSLCKTLSGLDCPLLTVTNFSSGAKIDKRPFVVVSARVHPGESNASWMMRGFLRFITSGDPIAGALRNAYIFKIVPMLNPDGVVCGNYRCNLAGHDLNRQYGWPKKESSPTVLNLKRMISGCCGRVFVFCDLHGHSRSKNVFAYGCDESVGTISAEAADQTSLDPFQDLEEECVLGKRPHLEIPLLLHRLNAHFSFGQCSYKVQKSKATTGRVVVFKQLKVPVSFTIEASLCGWDAGHFGRHDLEKAGTDFARALWACSVDGLDAKKARRDLEAMVPIAPPKQKGATSKKKKKSRRGVPAKSASARRGRRRSDTQ